MNYRKTVMDAVADGAMDTQAHLSEADARLERYGDCEARMDERQERAYALLHAIAAGADREAAARAKAALVEFDQAERWETEADRTVAGGRSAVRRASERNRAVIGLAEQHRGRDARTLLPAQRRAA